LDGFRDGYLAQFKTEGKPRDTFEEGGQFPVTLDVNVTCQPGIKGEVTLSLWKTAKEHQVSYAGEQEGLAQSEESERTQQPSRAVLFTMDVKGGKDIGIKKVMWNAQTAQHSGQYSATAKGHHMYCTCTDLYPLIGFGSEAPTTMRQSLQNYYPFTPL